MTARYDEVHIGLVVEGRGEVEALPLLLRSRLYERRIFKEILGRPVPCHGRENALREKGLEGKVAVSAARPGCRAVFVVLDGEGDAICKLGPSLRMRSETTAGGKPVVVCLADPKFEAWLVASAESLGLPGLEFRRRRDPVTLIKEALAPVKYVKPTWQPRLSQRVDFELARNRDGSFNRLISRFDDVVDEIISSAWRSSGAEDLDVGET